MSISYSDPVLDALVAASESLMLNSPSARPSLASGGVRGSGGVDALSELEGTTSSKFLYSVSDDIDCSDVTLCFGMIGAGSSFCVRRNCSIGKHAVSKFPLAGTTGRYVFIRRNVPATVFAKPCLFVDRIPLGVRVDWSSKSLPLSEWTLQFQAVDNTNDALATEDNIKEETLFLSKAELLKTPAKRKRDLDDEVILSMWQGPKLERTLPSPGEDLEAFIDIGVSTKDSLIKAVAAVESNVQVMNEGVTELTSLTHNRFVSSEATVDTVMGVVQSLKSRVGDPVEVEERFVAPTLWGTISMVADEVVDMRTSFDRFAEEIGPMKTRFTEQVAKLTHDGNEGRKTVALVVSMVGGLVEKAQEMRTFIIDLKQQVAAKKGDDGAGFFSRSRSR